MEVKDNFQKIFRGEISEREKSGKWNDLKSLQECSLRGRPGRWRPYEPKRDREINSPLQIDNGVRI
jgi:hypothetical protein